MRTPLSAWNRLFIFCLGLSIASAFAMKWIEPDIQYKNEPVSILGLELWYSKERITAIFGGIELHARKVLQYHLYFDFVFMAGVFPGIASLCMITFHKTPGKLVRNFLFFLAAVQVLGWGFDLLENYYLLKWLDKPIIPGEFSRYTFFVLSKWIIALSGLAVSLYLLVSIKLKKTKFSV